MKKLWIIFMLSFAALAGIYAYSAVTKNFCNVGCECPAASKSDDGGGCGCGGTIIFY